MPIEKHIIRLETRRYAPTTFPSYALGVQHVDAEFKDIILRELSAVAGRELVERGVATLRGTAGQFGTEYHGRLEVVAFKLGEYEAHVEEIRRDAFERGRNIGRFEQRNMLKRAISKAIDGVQA